MKLIAVITFLLFSSNIIAAKKRNVLIFMAADNDLEHYAIQNLNEIEISYPKKMVNQIVAQTHLTDRSFISTINNTTSYVVETKNLVNPAKQLNTFLTKYSNPNEENILIIWGHGQGPLKDNSPQNFGGVFTSSKNYLPLSTESLGNTLSKHHISMLIFDMCLMQNLQVIEDLNHSVEIIIGSAQIQNLIGLPYYQILNSIDREIPLQDVAKEIVTHTSKSMPNKNFTISAVYDGETNHLTESFLKLTELLTTFISSDPYLIFLYSNYFIDLPSFPGEYYDLGMYLGILKKIEYENSIFPKSILNQINKVQDELSYTLLAKDFGSEYMEIDRPYYIEFFQGLSITQEMIYSPTL